MIFCGDTVFPNIYDDQVIDKSNKDFIQKNKIVNLESLIDLNNNNIKKTSGIALRSSKQIVKFFEDLNVIAVSQANNHITDFDESIDQQKKYLKKYKIDSFGAGNSYYEASKPFFYDEKGVSYAVIAFGWKAIGCEPANAEKKGVNPLKYEIIIDQVINFFNKFSGVKLICVFHWDYEFELYPQPAHRQLAFELIDMGVEAIIGHHPHIVQGYEIYKSKPIFYSLGNFYFPNGNYNGYNINFSEEARNGLCVELNDDFRDIKLYWTYLDENKKMLIKSQENLLNSNKLKDLSNFSGMEHQEYIKWFFKNRKKNKLLPVYKTINSKYETFFNDKFIQVRQVLVDFLVHKILKK